jgi:GNAT superfamily N-acetyltransferase
VSIGALIGAPARCLCRGAWSSSGKIADVPGTITIRALDDHERAWANDRYREIAFAATPPGAAALVAELAGARVGLGRLVEHAPGVVELGGIWTAEAARGLGVARRMVRALLDRSPHGGPLWCIPFVHLAPFYQSFGFVDRAAPWPPPIAAKVRDCIAHALPEVVVLARPA